MRFSERVNDITPSQTLRMAKMAKDLKSEGHDVINLTVGEPDFNTPASVIEATCQAMRDGATKYTDASGITELKTSIQEKMQRDHALLYRTNEIYVGAGAKQVLYNIFQSILNDGDEVLIPSPYWVSYPEQVKLAGGVPVIIETTEATHFKVTPEMIETAITANVKAIILTSPSNPTGVIYTEEELNALAGYFTERDITVISDEIYESLIYDGEHVSIAQCSQAMKRQTVIVNGVSKSHAMTGFRIGYACGDEELMKNMAALTTHSTSNASTPSQYAAIQAYQLPKDYLVKNRELFKERLEAGYARLMEIPYVECVKPHGAFYLFPNFKTTAEKCGFASVNEFSEKLLEETYVVTVPGSSFGADDNIRISYATDEAQLTEGLLRIKQFVESHI